MINLVTLWEFGWLPSNVENSMWRQLRAAFDVSGLTMVSRRNDPDGIIKFTDMTDALAQYDATEVFLIPNHGTDLKDFEHPANATYVFGNALQSNIELAQSRNCQIVQINTPKNVDFFAVNAAATVLYDRMLKCPLT